MSLVAVAIPVDDPQEIEAALDEARRAVSAGARVVEWRVDAIVDRLLPAHAPDALALVRRLVAEAGAPCIVTIRAAAEGGAFRGDDADRVAFIEALGTGDPAPRYIDFELAAFERSANLRQKVRLAVQHDRQARDLKTSLILSTHDFDARPADLMSRYARMIDEPACAVAKVAWRARSLRDCLEAFELLRERRKATIALCMGEFGLLTRVLAPKFGGLVTFARGERSDETAAGQPTVRELLERWRFARIGAATRVFGVIGVPIGHSRSPDLHNAGFDALREDAIHLPMPIEGSWESFKATVGAMIDFVPLDFAGASVTLPHKEHLVRFVRERGGTLCPISERSGSANTIIVHKDGGASGHAAEGTAARSAEAASRGPRVHLECVNTDAPAAVEAIEAARPLRGARIGLLGAGGAARALALGFLDAGATVTIFNRNADRVHELVNTMATEARPRIRVGGSLEDAASIADELDGIVNATSVGMRGGDGEGRSPLPEAFRFRPGQVVMDTVYAPRMTPLLQRARDGGATAIDGSEMFVRQAEAQFRLWTGRAPPEGLFRRVLDQCEREP